MSDAKGAQVIDLMEVLKASLAKRCPDCGEPKHKYWWDCPKLKNPKYSFRMAVKIPGKLISK